MDYFVWLDPADAVFVASCREALKIERRAWEVCNEERMALLKKTEPTPARLPEIVKITVLGKEYLVDASGWSEEEKWWKKETQMTKLVEGLTLAAIQFRDYQRQHLAKKTLEGNMKAAVNAHMADKCEEALSYDWSGLERKLLEAFDEQGSIYRRGGMSISNKDKASMAVQLLQKEGIMPSHASILSKIREGITTTPVQGPVITHLEYPHTNTLVTAIWSDGERTSLDLRNYPNTTEDEVRRYMEQKRLEG